MDSDGSRAGPYDPKCYFNKRGSYEGNGEEVVAAQLHHCAFMAEDTFESGISPLIVCSMPSSIDNPLFSLTPFDSYFGFNVTVFSVLDSNSE